MNFVISLIIVVGLVWGPTASGHGIKAQAHPEMVHGVAGDVSCKDESTRDSEMTVCCEVFGGHCTPGSFLKEPTTLVVWRPQGAKVLISSDQLQSGIDSEAETPPPRI